MSPSEIEALIEKKKEEIEGLRRTLLGCEHPKYVLFVEKLTKAGFTEAPPAYEGLFGSTQHDFTKGNMLIQSSNSETSLVFDDGKLSRQEFISKGWLDDDFESILQSILKYIEEIYESICKDKIDYEGYIKETKKLIELIKEDKNESV